MRFSSRTMSPPLPPPPPLPMKLSFHCLGIFLSSHQKWNHQLSQKSSNQASFRREFQCSLILEFEFSSQSTCVFVHPTSLVISPPSSVGPLLQNLNFIEGKVRAAACTSVAVADCLSWRSVSNTSFKVNPPVIPLVPRVKVRGPRYVHVCDTPVFDLDLSSGSGGYPWSSLTVTVTSETQSTEAEAAATVAAAIEDFFSTVYDVNNDPMPIPSGLFHSAGSGGGDGSWYLLHFTLCNYLLFCDSTDHLIEIINIVGWNIDGLSTVMVLKILHSSPSQRHQHSSSCHHTL
jgi:hypothetical protein